MLNIRKLYELIYNFHLLKNQSKIEIIHSKNNQSKTIKDNISDSPFFSSKFKKDLDAQIVNNLYQIHITGSLEATINIYTSSLSLAKVRKLVQYIMFVVYLNKYYWHKELNSSLNIYIVPLDINKSLPKYNKTNTIPIGIENINSASTNIYFNNPGMGEVFIWRKSELSKVLVHELLHSFNYDQNLLSFTKSNTSIFSNINSLNLNETYTELTANILCLALNSFKNIKGMNKSSLFRNFQKIFYEKLEKENMLSQNNVMKLIKYNKLNNVNDFVSKKYSQDASIFSYVVLKAAIIYQIYNQSNSKNKEVLFLKDFPLIFNGDKNTYVSELSEFFNNKRWQKNLENLSKKNIKMSGSFYFTTIKG